MNPVIPRRVQVFFYGLFMDVDALRAKGADPVHVRRAQITGFVLRIGQRATLVHHPGARVHGVVMDLTHDEMDRIYAEPGVREYRPEAVIAEFDDGTHMPALCFNLIAAPRPDEKNEEYARRLREVAARAGLPASYVASIG
jgi:gamma-glutamyl AIG2-like cyclotransferase